VVNNMTLMKHESTSAAPTRRSGVTRAGAPCPVLYLRLHTRQEMNDAFSTTAVQKPVNKLLFGVVLTKVSISLSTTCTTVQQVRLAIRVGCVNIPTINNGDGRGPWVRFSAPGNQGE
jgi:hypothetical protein